MSIPKKRYRLRPKGDKKPKYTVNNSPAIRAYQAGWDAATRRRPVPPSLQGELARVNERLAAGEPLDKVLGRPAHRPKASGFTPDDYIVAYVALRKHELGGGRDALARAKREACDAFPDLASQNDPERVVRRAWDNAGKTIGSLAPAELEKILAPMEIQQT